VLLAGLLALAGACSGPAARPLALDDEQQLRELVDKATAEKQLPRALAELEPRRDALGLWFQGRVRYLMAESEPPAQALATLDTAMACFQSSPQKNPAYADTCEQWLAMCLGKKGNIAFGMGDLPHAEAWLLDATRMRPDRIRADLGGGETVKLGLLRVGDKYMRTFAKTEAFFRAAVAAADPDVDLLNNAAVYARDRGVQLEKAGKREEAARMFERSHATYLRAVELDPLSVRLRNDCALVAIYYIESDWDEARALLEGAIADGERQLHENPPADARERQDLDEAIGDAYENLALWHLKHGQDAAAAQAAARASLLHFPGEKREGAQRHLEAAQKLLLDQESGKGAR
jgi:tetratricopeptide (TPR) repeat protein